MIAFERKTITQTLLFLCFCLLPITSTQAYQKRSPSPPISLDDFVLVQGGCFDMGDTFEEGYQDELPVHQVCLDDYYLSKYEITRAQWRKIFPLLKKWRGYSERLPITGINWKRVQNFIKRLNQITHQNFRLPTEAEWEYACREGGKVVRFGNGKNFADPREINFDASPGFQQVYSGLGNSLKRNLPVGSYPANALGLYDMSGNAREWVMDSYSEMAYHYHQKENPFYLDDSHNKIVRDGRGDNDAQGIRCTHRLKAAQGLDDARLGFRLALSVQAASSASMKNLRLSIAGLKSKKNQY
ncbi:MAG: hypothetical protein COB67_05540 [SAR324 cluster bacterium]|uniref:Sulfatase-modifying factor enzyme-like domain-containing protein n=1 Tax=SAR324 cluster bacterium TaxID=2024889 RepID=A0A2A4T5G4_9DELT|nr:MAG: hypothetical protein COB67_05540 [SAR324 cluster bacterium]